jgi:hypothetical protein
MPSRNTIATALHKVVDKGPVFHASGIYGYRGAKPENISLKKIKIISEWFEYKGTKLKD